MSRPPPRRNLSCAQLFREAIEAAVAEGVSPDDMRLRVTRSDAMKLKRDDAVALTDISFADGVMRYLGVSVVEGGVAESVLDRTSKDG